MTNNIENQGSFRQARRRAERVPDVAQRHQHHKQLAILTPGLVKAANDVIAFYDDDEKYTANTESVLQVATTKVDALHELLVQWAAVIRTDIPGFEADRFGLAKRSHDDVLVGAKLLLEVVNGSEDTQPALAYAGDVTEEVEPALDEASDAVIAAKAVRAKRKEKRTARRVAVTTLHRELVKYRRVLGRKIGRNHPDYIALRFRTRAKSTDAGASVTEASATSGAETAEGDSTLPRA